MATRRRHPACALLAALLLAAPAQAAAPAPGSETAAACDAAGAPTGPHILATATGARRVAGNITFTLYGDQPARFLAHRGSIALTRVTLTGAAATACFAVSRPGVYAVAIYHDENDNHHFDRSLIGLPVEGYGFSRNAAIFLGPPSFAAVRFEVGAGGARIAMALRY